jgi:hypothetical protein
MRSKCFANAFLAIVHSVCMLSSIANLLKFCSPHSFSLSHFSLFEWFVPTYFFKHFKSCSCPSITRHHPPHNSLIIMVLTRRSRDWLKKIQKARIFGNNNQTKFSLFYSLHSSSYYLPMHSWPSFISSVC